MLPVGSSRPLSPPDTNTGFLVEPPCFPPVPPVPVVGLTPWLGVVVIGCPCEFVLMGCLVVGLLVSRAGVVGFCVVLESAAEGVLVGGAWVEGFFVLVRGLAVAGGCVVGAIVVVGCLVVGGFVVVGFVVVVVEESKMLVF